MKLKMTVAGRGKVRTRTRSNGWDGSTASSSSVSVARTRGSISATRRGVNARDAGRRRRVCAGGARLNIDGWGVGAAGEQDLGRRRVEGHERHLRRRGRVGLRVVEDGVDVGVPGDDVAVER